MSLKEFEGVIKYHSSMMLPLSMKEVIELKNKHLKGSKEWKKADTILENAGYSGLTSTAWKQKLNLGGVF